MNEPKFEKLKGQLCIRRDVKFKQEDPTIKKLEAILFEEGLVKKVVLNDDSPIKYYNKTRLYIDNNEINGVILALDSLPGHAIRRNDHNIYLIGNGKFKKRIKKVLKNKYFSKHL